MRMESAKEWVVNEDVRKGIQERKHANRMYRKNRKRYGMNNDRTKNDREQYERKRTYQCVLSTSA